MTVFTRDLCGFNNAQAKISASYDDSFSPPRVTLVTIVNNGGVVKLTVDLFNLDGTHFRGPFTRTDQPGTQTIDVQQVWGTINMVDQVSTKDGSHGWAFPFVVQCSSG